MQADVAAGLDFPDEGAKGFLDLQLLQRLRQSSEVVGYGVDDFYLRYEGSTHQLLRQVLFVHRLRLVPVHPLLLLLLGCLLQLRNLDLYSKGIR